MKIKKARRKRLTTKVFAKAGLDNVIFGFSNMASVALADIYKFGF